MYVIRVNKQKKYVVMDERTGKPSATTNLSVAQKYDTKVAANNYIKNCIPKAARKRYDVVSVEDEKSPWDAVVAAIEQEDTPVEASSEKSDTLEHIIASAEELDDSQEGDSIRNLDLDVDWESMILKYSEIVKTVMEYNSYCKKKLNEMEHRKIIDIRHFVEFTDLNAVQGFKMYKFEQSQLRKRRKLKDIIAITDEMMKSLFKSGNAQPSLDVIESQKQRSYNPRIFDALFEKGINALDELDT